MSHPPIPPSRAHARSSERHSGSRRGVLVLGGGPDAEREVSLLSAGCIAEALTSSGEFEVHHETIERLTGEQLAALGKPDDVIFPALHGGWGEGGQLQDLLEWDGRAFVGCGSQAARHAMDKIATKHTALRLGIPTAIPFILDVRDSVCPIPFPVVIKPVHEGSTIGLFVCRSNVEWVKARERIDEDYLAGIRRTYMIEPCIGGTTRAGAPAKGRELTVGILDGKALPVIEIVPAEGLYDYQAKYTREDTQYKLDPPLPPGITEQIQEQTAKLAREMGVRHLARTDFMLDGQGKAWFLEINTLPGFTTHSLVPMAARHIGIPMPELCASLVRMAIRDHAATPGIKLAGAAPAR